MFFKNKRLTFSMLKCVLERISPFYPKGRLIVMSGTTWRKYYLFLFLYFLYGINEKNKGIEKSRGGKKITSFI